MKANQPSVILASKHQLHLIRLQYNSLWQIVFATAMVKKEPFLFCPPALSIPRDVFLYSTMTPALRTNLTTQMHHCRYTQKTTCSTCWRKSWNHCTIIRRHVWNKPLKKCGDCS